jgi:hypothetical protein
MTTAMWNGDYDAAEQGEYVFYRDIKPSIEGPSRDLLTTREAVGILVGHYSERAEEYDNLLLELRDILNDEANDYSVTADDLRRRIAPWLEPTPAPA